MELANRLWGQNKAKSISELSEEIKIILGDLLRLCPEVQVLLFGSFAAGVAIDSSDLDLAVIVPDVVDLKSFKKDFYKQRTRIQIPVDFVFRNQSQFESASSDNPVDDEIRQKGVEIYPKWTLNSEV